jgi:UDP-glucose 4-epimerase
LKSVSESSKSPLDYFDNNVRSTISLLKIMAEVGVKKIIFSSSATIYDTNFASPFDESSPKLATTPYGQSKLIIEDLLENICRSDEEWKVVILRYFNPIGAHPSGLIGECPRGIPNNLFPFILKVASGQLEKLCIFGNDYPTPDGTGTRDYIHVCDLAAGHAQSLALLSNRSIVRQPATYNLGTGRPLSVLELLKIFENTNNVSIPFEIGPRRLGDSPIVYSNAKRALRDLAWSATRTPQDMCRDGWAWQKSNPY